MHDFPNLILKSNFKPKARLFSGFGISIRTYLQDADILKLLFPYTEYDKGHGRLESRTCFVNSDVSWLHSWHPKWRSIGCLIRIDSVREIKGKKSTETRYYIGSNSDLSSKTALSSIRSHWAIENCLHWVLDMSFGDDMSRIRKENAPQIMAIIRHIALNMPQTAKSNMKRQSIKRLRKVAGWND
jgi:predicted transposase YbfD/YdcC